MSTTGWLHNAHAQAFSHLFEYGHRDVLVVPIIDYEIYYEHYCTQTRKTNLEKRNKKYNQIEIEITRN